MKTRPLFMLSVLISFVLLGCQQGELDSSSQEQYSSSVAAEADSQSTAQTTDVIPSSPSESLDKEAMQFEDSPDSSEAIDRGMSLAQAVSSALSA